MSDIKTDQEKEIEELKKLQEEGEKYYKEGLQSRDSRVRTYYKNPDMRKIKLGGQEFKIIIPYGVHKLDKSNKRGSNFTAPKAKRRKSKKRYGKK